MSSAGQLSELDLLRGQVVNLSRQLAERDRSMQDLRERSQLLRTIVEGTASGTGDEFFASLVRHLTSTLHVQYAVISEVLEVPFRKIRTLAVSAGDTLIDNFEYDLDHTPCATALTQTFACFNRDLQATFPEFQRLVDLGAESYCAVPIRTKDGEVRGLLVVMDTKPLQHGEDLQSLMEVFAPRVGAEFERRRVEQEHAMALAEIHNVIETVPDIMFTLDTHGNMVKWNRRVEDVTGYSPEELLNMPALAFVPPEEHIPTAAAIERAFTEGYAELEGHLLTKDSRAIPYHVTGALLKNAHGEPIGITGIGRDVSEKKQAEEALRRSEERLVLAVAGSNDVLWDAHRLPGEPWYAPQTSIWWSPRVRELLGLQESESFETLEQWAARLHPDDKDRVFGQLAAHIEQRVPYDVEYRLRTNAGDYRWVRGRGQALWDKQGEPRRMSGSCQDITELKQAEEERQKQEVLITLMLNTGPACIKRIAADGSLLHMNPTGLKMVEACGELEVVGRSVFNLVAPEHRDAFISMHRRVIEEHECTLQFEVQGLKGTRRWMESYAAPFRNPVTGQTEHLAVTHDIADRKRAEEALHESEAFNVSVLNSLSSQIVVLNSQGVIMAVNKPWLRFAEENQASHLVENFVGMNYLNVCAQAPLFANGEEAASAQAGILAVLAGTHNEFSLEYPCHSPDRQRWFRMRVTPLLGSQAGVVVAHENITERKQAEEALRKSEEHFRAIFENTAVGIAFGSHMTGTGISEANPAFQSMTGYNLEELCRLGMKGVTYPDDLRSSKAFVEQLVSGALTHGTIEKRYVKKDGSIMWAQTTVSSVLDEQGRYENSVAMIQDITTRKINEQLLVAEKRVLEMIATDAPLQEILTLMCRTVEELSPSTRCSILLLHRDGLHLRHGAAPSLPEAYVRAIDGVAIGPTVGSCGTAAFTRRQVIVSNIADDPLWTDYRDLALGHGLQACWSTPVISSDGAVLGTFALYYGEPQQPTHAELRLIERVAHFARITIERKQAEEALRKSEERFNLAVQGSSTGIWDWDLQTNTTYFSPLWKSMLGYEEHELKGEFFEWEERLHPNDRERSLATVRAYLEGTTPQYELEHRLCHKDGNYRWILARGVSICDAEGKPYRMAGSHIDITKQKQTQEALVQSERQLRTVLDALPVGVWFTDRSGKPLFANPAAKQIWSNIKQIGLQTENPQAGWWETIGPANEPHRWALSHVLTTGVPSQYETFDFECLDGTRKTIRNSTVPVKNADGVILGAVVLNEDITTLRQAQAALQMTQFSVDHAVEGFLWIGSDARIFHVNDSICRMLEYTWEELTTMTLHDIDPNLTSEVWPAHWEELKAKGSLTFESKYWSRTGRVLDMEVTVNYLQYEGKEYNCTIMRDIGERKRAEASLHQSEERYRSLVDNAPIGIFLNEAGRFVYANREMLRILKATNAEQLIGTPVLDRIAPEFHTLVKERIRELTMGQPVLSLNEKFVRFDGSQVDVAVSAIPTSLGGNPVMQVLALDITERKQSAAREVSHIRQLKKLYELSMTLSGDPNLVLEHAVRIIGELFNVQVVCLSEIVGQELYFKSVYINGQTFTDAGHCSLAITPCATVEQAKDVRIFDRVMERFPEASFLRDHQAVSYCGFPALDSDGRVVAVACLLDNKPHDFSKEEQDLLRIFGQRIAVEIERSRHNAEQKRAEKELRKSHAFIRQIIDTHPNFIFAKDREGRFTLVNKAVADVYGTTVENLIGKTDSDFNPNQEEVASFSQQDLAVMDTLHELFLPEEVITGFDGRTRWLQTVKRPILDDEGCAIMVLGSSTDITERKRMEETLRQRERDLQAALQERERISQDLHDGILQSLFAVGLALESAKLSMAPKNLKMSRASLNQAIDQLNDVMREIRNFIAGLGSDLLQGKNLPAALKQMLASLTEHQAMRVRLAVEDRAVKALSTEQSLHLVRVIQEAVSNCIRHGHAQEARVSLKMLKRGVRLSVRDNGRGFNQATAKRTGHGLTNMAARARKIGGRFTILSKVNEGTSIVLDLPKEAADVSR